MPGALFYPFNPPPHSPLRWIGAKVAPLLIDDFPPLLADLGGAPISGQQPWWSHCGVEQGGDVVPGLPVVRRWVQKPADDAGVKFLGGRPVRRNDLEGVKLVAFLGDGMAEVGEGIQEVRRMEGLAQGLVLVGQ